MHRPVFAVCAGELGRLGCGLGERVDVCERKIAVNVPHAVAEVVLQPANDGVSDRTVRALEVAVLDERDRRAFVTLDVVVVGHGNGEVAHRALLFRFEPLDAGAARMVRFQ